MKDLHSNVKVSRGLSPAAYTTSQNGTEVDLAGFEAAECVITTGVVTDGTHTFKIEESDVSGSGYATAADDDVIGVVNSTGVILTTAAGDDNQVARIGYRGRKRYVRIVTVAAGTTTGGIYGAVWVLGQPRNAPVANQDATT